MPPIPGIFHPIVGLTPQERTSANIREFVGDGTPHLPVPGLTKLVSLQVGRTPIPLERDYKFPLNADFTQKITVTLPHAGVVDGPDGVPVLVRSMHSNDGVWQKGEKVYVGGDWDDAPAPDAPAESAAAPSFTANAAPGEKSNGEKADAPHPLDVVGEILKLPVDEIRRQAAAAGVADADRLNKNDLAIALAKAAGYSPAA